MRNRDHIVFVFLFLTYLLNIMCSGSIFAVTNDKIPLFFVTEYYSSLCMYLCVCVCVCVCVHQLFFICSVDTLVVPWSWLIISNAAVNLGMQIFFSSWCYCCFLLINTHRIFTFVCVGQQPP